MLRTREKTEFLRIFSSVFKNSFKDKLINRKGKFFSIIKKGECRNEKHSGYITS